MAKSSENDHRDPLEEKLTKILGKPRKPEELSKGEIWWRDHQPWLETCGYSLRDRYKPGWIPSWTQGVDILYAEDYEPLMHPNLMNATWVAHNKNVMLKKLSRTIHPYEVELTAMWSEPHLANHPHNHCVQLIEVLTPPNNPDIAILVLPLFRDIFRPDFRTIGEVVDFFHQAFEGLKFIHDNHVAHRDCNQNNIMMDASVMYPDGWHISHPNHAPGVSSFADGKSAKHFTRTERPPKYFFIDFGISRKYEASDTAPIEDIIRGGDKSPPEFGNPTGQCNPFPTDVYYLGNTIRRYFLGRAPELYSKPGYHGLEFIQSLVEDMVNEDPEMRPTMNEVVQRFEAIRSGLSSWKLRSRLVPREEHVVDATVRICCHWKKVLGYTLQRIPSVPLR